MCGCVQHVGDRWDSFYFHCASNGGFHVGTDVSTRIRPNDSPKKVREDVLQMVSFTYDSDGTGRVYLDAQLVAEKAMTAPKRWNEFRIKEPDGLFDNVMVWNRWLSEEEIQMLFEGCG